MISSYPALDWALIALSLFNAALLLWLGLTVFLNAERRTWGVWLVEEGLVLGALFFASHTVILGHEMTIFGSQDLETWWRIGWYPVLLAPYAWYVVILWFVGYWEEPDSPLRRRHRLPLRLVTLGTAALLLLLTTRRGLPSYIALAHLDLSDARSVAGVPLLFLLFPPLALVCIALPLDALRNPGPARRMMGDLARQRARPWLEGVSLALLAVCALVGAFVIWVAYNAQARDATIYGVWVVDLVAVFDLVIELLIAGAVLLLGQAIVTYEVFTGQVLPRRGFARQWRSTILLAAALAGTVSYTLIWDPLPVFSLLLATLVMVVLHALFSWRSFVNREEFMARLRPFVRSQGLMQHLLQPEADTQARATQLFGALCDEVLNARRAELIPLGVLAPLAGPPLHHPATAPRRDPLPSLTGLLADTGPGAGVGSGVPVVQLDAAAWAGLHWAIPLWAERGLTGVLLLGPKRDGGLYTQEEIEIARASAERIIDLLAGAQMARRLMDVQRRRLAETRVLDLRTRRTLHDEVLPTLHTAVLSLGGLARREPAAQDAIQALSDVHQQISHLIHAPNTAAPTATGSNLVEALRMTLESEFSGAFDGVTWETVGSAPRLDPLVQEVVFGAAREAVRNAAVHARGTDASRPLHLFIGVETGDGLRLRIRDDGVGLRFGDDPAHAGPGANGTGAPGTNGGDSGGSGGGLALHSTMLAIVGGTLDISAPPDGGTQVVIALPDTLRETASSSVVTGAAAAPAQPAG